MIDLERLTDEQRRALRGWFYDHAYIPDPLSLTSGPNEVKTGEFRQHIVDGCSLVWKKDPTYEPVLGFKAEMVDGKRTRVEDSGQWSPGMRAWISCECGKYDRQFGHGETWFIPERRGIMDVLRGRSLEKAVAEALTEAGCA